MPKSIITALDIVDGRANFTIDYEGIHSSPTITSDKLIKRFETKTPPDIV